MVSKPEKQRWFVTLEIDYAAQEWKGANVIPIPDPVMDVNEPYVLVQAYDEIGAFNEAQRVLQRLNFRVAA